MPAQPPPAEIDVTPSEAVVEFGSEPDPTPSRKRRWDLSGTGRELLADRRTVPLLAALAALAALVSALSEWQVTNLAPNSLGGESPARVLPAGLDDLGALGIGYVLGLFLLVPVTVLTLFGPLATRHTFRLTGLSVAGTMGGVLIAVASRITSESYVIDPVYRVAFDTTETSLSYGRGVWCAFIAVILAAGALYLAGQHLAGDPVPDEEADPEEEPAAVWSWRRPSRSDDDFDAEPMDLTVSPSQPFTTLHDDRDRPS
ncbi:hypothetical protein KOI35_08340 [Actinoplanes bogorensis]|uniref:DNA translocase FtsK 4TM region domain-containing protein n=1 Tax=Paractinoplanes bogorensis TaxID=1610840 RepID=A0ABS5YJJ2_9ACTN|nr:hypothetical protein [Actinoplanes bogorensis]MBU2663511.1 hypothetical protein [Actinoplanes bogorensis]